MPCNAISFQKATVDDLFKALAKDIVNDNETTTKIANFLKSLNANVVADVRNATSLSLSFKIDGTFVQMNINADGRVKYATSGSRTTLQKADDALAPFLRALAVAKLQTKVAAFAAQNGKVNNATRTSNGALVLDVTL